MFEPVQQQSAWHKVLGCLVGLVGGGLAFVSLLVGVCAGAEGGDVGVGFYLATAVVGVLGIALLLSAFRPWRKP
jgi:hypothetical protein